MSHANAVLTPRQRLGVARAVRLEGLSQRVAARMFNCSVTTVRRWVVRFDEVLASRGQVVQADMGDASSRPRSCPWQLDRRIEHRIVGLRVSRRWGPARIAYRLGLAVSSVAKVLARYGCPRLAWVDPRTGTRAKRSRRARRYEHAAPGDLVHVDIKELGKIPDGGGHRAVGRQVGRANRGSIRRGKLFIHAAVDDHSRLAYAEILDDLTGATAAGFWTRAHAYYASVGIDVARVLTDNGSAYKSRAFAESLGDVTHKRTRPYRPQTNGKVERLNRTMVEEWAYERPYSSETERCAAFGSWLHTYNHHRGHTALGGLTPADRVTNLRGQNT